MNPTIDLKTLLKPRPKASPFVPIKLYYRIGLVILLGLQLLIEFIEFLNSPNEATSWAALAALGQSIMLYLPIFFYRKSYGWFHPLVFIPLYTFAFNLPTFIPKVITLLVEGSGSLNYVPITSVALRGWGQESLINLNAFASLVTIISLGAYYLGFFLLPAPKTPKLRLRPIKYPGIKTLVAVLFSLLVFAIFLQLHGGLGGHLIANWLGGRHANLAGKYYWAFFINFGLVGCLIWLGMDSTAFIKPLFWGCAITAMMTRFLYSGSRGSVIFFLMIGVMIWMMRKGRFSFTKVIVIILVAILGVGILGTFRNVVRDTGVADVTTLTDLQGGITKAIGNDEEAGELTGGRNGGPLPMLAYVPKREGYLYGSTYLAAVTLFIPRSIWPDKPGLCGSRASRTFYFENANWGIPCGSIGEAYWNFGIPGVCVAFFLYGYFHKWLANSFRKYSGEVGMIVLYAIALFYIRPDTTVIMKAVQLLIQAVILLYLWGGIAVFSRRRKRIG
ncbi:MAG: O-antigen polysaccharide polymerase Wzy [Gloeocapsa sp. DLM2.Bin57]|nr:MAG: O-antigen polysaccharide polymerase Wzy [Gloeocapsa sp. DLM2.Bin57]